MAQHLPQQKPSTAQPPPSPAPRRHPRWELLAVPLALLLGPWFFRGCDAPLRWRDVTTSLGVRWPEDYTATAALAAVLVAGLLILRLYRTPPA
jgi:hypothetical protein